MLMRMWRNKSTCTLWVEMQSSTAITENSKWVLQRELPYHSADPITGHLLKGNEINMSKRCPHSCIYYSIIHNSQDMEST